MKETLKAFLSLSLALGPAGAQAALPGAYRVAPGDILAVKVMDQAALSSSYTVAPDRSITLPLIGEVPVGELTLPEAEARITGKLKDGYLQDPVVTVSLEKSAGRPFFIYGEIKTPGEYKLIGESVTVLQAIAMAGGLTKSGSESKVRILRPDGEGNSYSVIEVDLKKVLATGEGDALLQPRDIVVVREGWF